MAAALLGLGGGGAAAARRATRRIFLSTTPGLERALERELQALRVPGHIEPILGGVVLHGVAESLWRAVLLSRVAESAHVYLGGPFHAPDVRALDDGLRGLPWKDCLELRTERRYGAAAMPTVTVSSSRSRMYHKRLIQEHTVAAIEAQGAGLPADAAAAEAAPALDDRPSAAADAPGATAVAAGVLVPPGAAAADTAAAAGGRGTGAGKRGLAGGVARAALPQPTVHVQLRHDSCQVSVGASGGKLHQRNYRKAVGDAPLRETLAAACVLATPLLRQLTAAAHSGEELVLWDPFCGSGVLVLEALGIVLGEPPGDHRRPQPYMSFPWHAACGAREYEAAAEAITRPAPHPALSRLSLLGTDTSPEQVERAQRNLRRLARRLWHRREAGGGGGLEAGAAGVPGEEDVDRLLPLPVRFEQGHLAKHARGLAGKPTMIVTNVPWGAWSGAGPDARSGRPEVLEAYGQLGRLLWRRKADWRGVFCLVADADDFRQHTGLEWTSQLQFLNGTRWVDLVQWTGQRGTAAGSTRRSRGSP